MGKLVAMSVLQGGPGLPILWPAAYHYLCSGLHIGPHRFSTIDIPDPLVRRMLELVIGLFLIESTFVQSEQIISAFKGYFYQVLSAVGSHGMYLMGDIFDLRI